MIPVAVRRGLITACASCHSLADSWIGTTLSGARCLTYAVSRMKDLLIMLLHLVIIIAKLCGPGSV